VAALEIALVGLLVLWQVVVAVLLAVLFRQVTLISTAVGLVKEERDDHLLLGRPVPQEFEAQIAATGARRVYVIWLSSSCSTCSAFAEELGSAAAKNAWTETSVILLTGSGRATETIAALMDGIGELVVDPLASAAVEALTLDQSPFVVEVRDGVISGWAALRTFDDLTRLRDSTASADPDEVERGHVTASG